MNDPSAVGSLIASITTKIDMPAPLFELLCCLLDIGSTAAMAGGLNSAMTPSTKLSTPTPTGDRSKRLTESRNALRNCSYDGCYALSFRSTDYCWRHQDETPSEPEAEANWWEEKTE